MTGRPDPTAAPLTSATAAPTPSSMGDPETERLTRRALRLAQFTVAYNVVEGVVGVTAGIMAGLVSLVGFGLDSGIESAAAVLVGLRLAARLRHGQADERKERRALRGVAVTFFLLAAYVVVEGVRSLIRGEEPDQSLVGIILLSTSLIVMPVLAAAKQRVGRALGGDRLILADAAETKICMLLSVSTLLGLGLYALTGAAWLDPVAGFVIAVFALNEGREAWEGELVEDEDDDPTEADEDARPHKE
ncbi:cation diffusion facilitator family transporter [Intrasporangium calvum]|uniref:cation diffusion facilitator family transporter n=1 Tax=Intrasporangium calvum TaxID=53358 RepID=UPI000DF6075B|nr:cation transporter [Intrasporangium calvum]AXG14099.1 cation transporter [Intrasporangium calvum]